MSASSAATTSTTVLTSAGVAGVYASRAAGGQGQGLQLAAGGATAIGYAGGPIPGAVDAGRVAVARPAPAGPASAVLAGLVVSSVGALGLLARRRLREHRAH